MEQINFFTDYHDSIINSVNQYQENFNRSQLLDLIKQVIISCNNKTIQKILDSLPFYVLLVDSDHQIIMANQAVENDLGISPEELIGSYCPAVIHNSDEPIPECPLEIANKEGHSVEVEFYEQATNKWFISAVYFIDIKTIEDKQLFFHMLFDITARKKAELELEESLNKINVILEQGFHAIIKIVERKDPYTAGHQQKVSDLAYKIATKMKMSKEKKESLRVAGLLHDVGKISVPSDILNRPGSLNIHEFSIIKSHPEEGYYIIKDIDFPWPVAQIVLQHHERLDGSGYPKGISKKNILIEARILAVADVVEAISSHRPYREALGLNEAIKEITRNSGVLYDSEVVEACLTVLNENYSS